MEQVNIYLYTTIKGPKKHSGVFVCILETETQRGPATLTTIKELEEATENQAELKALLTALKRVKKPCTLSIYTDSNYVAAGYECNRVEKWKESGWINAKGKPVANKEEWQEVAELLNAHEFQFIVKQHSYYSWMKSEAEKKQRRERYV